MTTTTFVPKPDNLPAPPKTGRVALVDLAFPFGDGYERVTKPFLADLGDRLALWVDHHDHPAWEKVRGDARFLLVPKRTARACPQLVTPEVVARAGVVDHLLAHADFDGCMAAAKFLNGGKEPYPGADEDARFSDAPGKGFSCSERGHRYVSALDWLTHVGDFKVTDAFLHSLLDAIVSGKEPENFQRDLDRLGRELEQHRRDLEPLLSRATRPHPKVLLLVEHEKLSSPDTKFLLREMEKGALVAIVYANNYSTVGTFDDEALDLRKLPGLEGLAGYAWGKTAPETFLPALARLLDGR